MLSLTYFSCLQPLERLSISLLRTILHIVLCLMRAENLVSQSSKITNHSPTNFLRTVGHSEWVAALLSSGPSNAVASLSFLFRERETSKEAALRWLFTPLAAMVGAVEGGKPFPRANLDVVISGAGLAPEVARVLHDMSPTPQILRKYVEYAVAAGFLPEDKLSGKKPSITAKALFARGPVGM